MFDTSKVSILPLYKSTNYSIKIIEGKEPLYRPLYNLLESELRVLREYIKENLTSGRIRYSTSPIGSPILFVPKKDGTIRLYIDYRGLDLVTIKDKCVLPLIIETLDRIIGARYFTSLDLKDAYYRIRIRVGSK